jgi:hypothetical protein
MDTLRHCGRGMADDEGMMENDSLDISQLKVLALEFHDEVCRLVLKLLGKPLPKPVLPLAITVDAIYPTYRLCFSPKTTILRRFRLNHLGESSLHQKVIVKLGEVSMRPGNSNKLLKLPHNNILEGSRDSHPPASLNFPGISTTLRNE